MMSTNELELLRDLADALASPEGRADPQGVLSAWAALVRGDVTPEARYRPCDPLTPRQHVALDLADRGPVSSGNLAQACGVSREAARLDLVCLAEKGLLRARGGGRGRRYTAG